MIKRFLKAYREGCRRNALRYLYDRMADLSEEIAMKRRKCHNILKRIEALERELEKIEADYGPEFRHELEERRKAA